MVEVKRKIKVPLYGGFIIVIISNDPNVRGSAIRHFKVDDKDLETYDAVCLESDHNQMPILFCKHISPGIIAHEALHTVNNICRYAGMRADRTNDEAEAYLLGWIVNRIWEVKLEYDKKLKTDEKSNRTKQ